ncbi:hypothetical protein [Streptomyces sp. NBC_01205]|uniref:hypothetical protein n=1 Tax=Streptomyces sp. NBC_01205 TaxID=2903771 RepID=UPI002E114593|nr:hypothetical protein OG573_43085 [Streptomyces sp. NBC_01205]
MRRRLAALLLALVAVFAVSVSAPQPAAADPIGAGIGVACQAGAGAAWGTILGPVGGVIGGISSKSLCDKVGKEASKQIKAEWDKVKKSLLGDIIVAIEDVARWILQKVFTVALMGPSVDLRATGLWGGEVKLSGMLIWLGLVIAVAGVMWQLGKMALTGQAKHAGRAMLGWVENMVLCSIGVSLFVLLLKTGDAISSGLVNETFADDGKALERILAVMIPKGIGNPILMLGVVQVLVIVGFIQLIMVFLRQSAIPIICLLLPVAGGGRAGGDVTRQWAPKLITSGLVIVAYKPMLALIICVGFAEFGNSATLAEWLRGCATLILAIIAPGPLTRIFAPFGAAVGGGMAVGGAIGAVGAAGEFIGGKASGGGDSGGGAEPTSAVQHAQHVDSTMGPQGGGGEDGSAGADAQAQAARNESSGKIPAQSTDEGQAVGTGIGETANTAGTAGSSSMAAAGPAGAAVQFGIEVIDGVNDAVQSAGGEVGGGNQE